MSTHPTPPDNPVQAVHGALRSDSGASQTSPRQQRHHRTPNGKTLTDRELEILTLAAGGHTNTEIGAKLYITVDTVKTHMRGLFAKLGARDRAHAVHLAHARGILCADPDELARLAGQNRVMRAMLERYEEALRQRVPNLPAELSPAQVFVAWQNLARAVYPDPSNPAHAGAA